MPDGLGSVSLQTLVLTVALTDCHAKYFAPELTKRCPSDRIEELAPVLADAKVDLNPHQVEAPFSPSKARAPRAPIWTTTWASARPSWPASWSPRSGRRTSRAPWSSHPPTCTSSSRRPPYPRTTPVEATPLAGKTVYIAAGGVLPICLERQLSLVLISAMAERRFERVVFLEEGFAGDDQLKANAVQTVKTQRIPGFKTA